ncbi:nucleotide exchange factor GrpE [Candidatus Micrarchaeota archaeon CG08_land_8_20_14_0_20_49_17]|nr:MAG: nucleotide exchange factor GrpE [Candidatus Micrarchaeota archaeon CG1_02_49_24]PIU09759.1 MAG: nucleotide exchange factor GrpE [Candidatus Micrarchaeota archaeon CG08_land_8_20_14_0_20_49_17]PIU81708.1 MAG: nucleotide exchange factor GrpE [Candidatus Micrarchaeota archaeon CG06_land_8_20_14_3_00_50_6]PIZ98056.1 MAG: nucleotide exchange factor GrpE [Candidatus Micrarchaeota archaeon CG_4_10_14_0_2_um_filter_49_7]HII53952.1 nucleotide exchange factor GrpE [Candidatus Micrarchaeota archae
MVSDKKNTPTKDTMDGEPCEGCECDGSCEKKEAPAVDDKIDYVDLYARKAAELENYKKLAGKQLDAQKFRAKEVLVRKFLPVMDDLEAGLAADGEHKGLHALQDKLKAILASEGLNEIEIPAGGKFDPYIHEVVQEMESEKENGTILQVIRKGYSFDGNVIRAAMVIVAKKSMDIDSTNNSTNKTEI